MNTSYSGIILVIIVSILASVVVAALNGHLFETSFVDLSDDSEYYNARALSLLRAGTLGEEDALFRRPPAYSFFLAGVYSVFGTHMGAAWLGHGILFGVSLFLLWRIGLFFLSSFYALFSPLAVGLYGGFNFYVFEIGSELFAATLVLALLFFILQYQKDSRFRYLILFGIAAGLVVLTKPVIVYAVPILIAYMVWQRTSLQTSLVRFGIVMGIAMLFVGGWMARTYMMFGELQIERAGHIIYTRALYGTLSWQDIGAHSIAALIGDYVADIFTPGYAERPVATRLSAKRTELFSSLLRHGYTRKDAEKELMRRGVREMIQYPLKFAVGAVPLLFELNTPENGSGFPITRMFVGTRNAISPWFKITILISIHSLWLLFLGFVVCGAYRTIKSSLRFVWPLVFLMAFFNLSHAFLIIPPEPRFLIPVLPLYFLFFTVGIQPYLTRVIKVRSVEDIV